ncbi:hypothetical protein [Nonomuraea sp. NPDC048901]
MMARLAAASSVRTSLGLVMFPPPSPKTRHEMYAVSGQALAVEVDRLG